jgi:hypothetical protein
MPKYTISSGEDLKRILDYILNDVSERESYAQHLYEEHATLEDQEAFMNMIMNSEDLIDKYSKEECDEIYPLAIRMREVLQKHREEQL